MSCFLLDNSLSVNWKLFAFSQTAPGPSTSTGLVPLLASPMIANHLIATVNKLTPALKFSISKRTCNFNEHLLLYDFHSRLRQFAASGARVPKESPAVLSAPPHRDRWILPPRFTTRLLPYRERERVCRSFCPVGTMACRSFLCRCSPCCLKRT